MKNAQLYPLNHSSSREHKPNLENFPAFCSPLLIFVQLQKLFTGGFKILKSYNVISCEELKDKLERLYSPSALGRVSLKMIASAQLTATCCARSHILLFLIAGKVHQRKLSKWVLLAFCRTHSREILPCKSP